jgi:dTDP-4-amino-4,6-dideoxygalactose transaminase
LNNSKTIGEWRIPIVKPKLPKALDVLPLLQSIDESHIYTNRGPLVEQLEELYANHFKVKSSQVVALANATLGITGCCAASPVTTWHIPSFTFAATGLAVLNSGDSVVFQDVDLKDWQLSTEFIEPNRSHTHGVIPVLPFGAPLDLEKWSNFKHVIIDAAASMGSGVFDLSVLPKSWFVVFSLHATKVLGAGEGAVVICGSEENALKLKSWANFGFNANRNSITIGTNAKMSEFAAAYGISSYMGKEKEKIEWLAVQQYIEKEGGSLFRSVVHDYPGFRPYWILQFSNVEQKREIEKILTNMDIQTRSWWASPLHEMPAFSGQQIASEMGNSIFLSSTVLGLPCFRDLHLSDVKLISNVLKANS